MQDIIDIYNAHLLALRIAQAESPEHADRSWFSISQAGMCFRKHYFKAIKQVKIEAPDPRSARLLRLGEIVHTDIQSSLSGIMMDDGEQRFLLELPVEIPQFHARGRIDVFDRMNSAITDIKTIASYKWKMMFGRKTHEPAKNYELQNGSYGLALREKGVDVNGLELLYYKKDDSSMKLMPLRSSTIAAAERYWTALTESLKDGLPPFEEGKCPVESWECNPRWCSFYNRCYKEK